MKSIPVKLVARVILFCSIAWQVSAAQKDVPFKYETDSFQVRLVPQKSEQIAAFYEGRGFSKQTIKLINTACFITVLIRNKGPKVIWLELNNWQFSSEKGTITRNHRSHWKKLMDENQVPLAHQATFGWTQLPETRDLQPNEPVGGNITFVKTQAPMNITARFKTGANKDGKEIVVSFKDVQCQD